MRRPGAAFVDEFQPVAISHRRVGSPHSKVYDRLEEKVRYANASGRIGEPVPPMIVSGAAMKTNS